MVEVKAREIAARVKSVGTGVRAVILFGPDQGMVRDHAKTIGKQIVEDLSDAFQVVRPAANTLKDTPSLLADEMAALSMLGGRRLIWLEGADKSCVDPVKLALSGAGDGFLLVTAGDIKKTDALVKPFVAAKDALAIPCYGDEGASLAAFVQSMLRGAGKTPTQDAMRYLVDNLGADRGVSRAELEKLILYMGDDTEVSLEDARANIGDASAFALSEIAAAVTAGNKRALEAGLERAWIGGDHAVAVLRTVSMRLMRFHLARAHMADGLSPGEAMKKLRPPVFWKETEAFQRDLMRWPLPKVSRALEILLEAESQCKTTGNPAQVLCARALLSITKAA